MCIGIHTGPVVVGTLANDLRVEFTAVGNTVNLAQRMQGLVGPGTTHVTEETFKLTEGFFRFKVLEHLDFAINESRDMKMQPSLERVLKHKEIPRA